MKSMFDIFTSRADGSLQLVESVGSLTKAQDLASRLSCLFPGEYFGCFERTGESLADRPEILKTGLNHACSIAFLV